MRLPAGGVEHGPADVTVVIPAHNSSVLLPSTLASVAAQTVKPAQVVLVDDQSVDDTATVAASWQDHLPLSVVRTDRNLGPGGARHVGITSSSTGLIALLDHDDYWFPDHLEAMLACYQSVRAPVIVSGNPMIWIAGHSVAPSPLTNEPLPPDPVQLPAILRRNFVSSAALFPRDLYDQVGGFRSRFIGTDDWDLWIRMVRAGAAIRRVSHHTLLYRLSETSMSSNIPEKELRFVDEELAVLRAAAAESRSSVEQAAARHGLRRLRARKQFLLARSYALEGKAGQARLAALRGLTGDRRSALRSAAIALAPNLAIRWRAARRERRRGTRSTDPTLLS
jgi:glycosyltransferase involved in cell wall biosynthesis